MRRNSKRWGTPGAVGLWQCALVVTCALVAGLWWSSRDPLLIGSRELAAPTRASIQAWPRSDAELELVMSLALDVWSENVADDHGAVGVVVVVSSDEIAHLARRGVRLEVLTADIDALARAERDRLATRARIADGGSGWFNEYRDIMEISGFVDALGEQHTSLVKLERIGTSVEGWPIRALKIGRGAKAIAVNGGQHAREWISVMVPLCIADRLARGDREDAELRRLLDEVTFFVVPLVNPDGYVYSWNVDRYWRKSRRGGHGVDLNRNYSVAFGGRGSSGNRRSQTYRGPQAFSEPESQALRDLFLREKIEAHIDFHSYSQLILYPWSHARRVPPDRDELAAISDRMSSAMFAEHDHPYKIVPGSELRIGASGTLSDWAYGEAGALSFIIELRPKMGSGGFVLPPEQIVPTCDEGFAAVRELAKWMIKRDERGSPGH